MRSESAAFIIQTSSNQSDVSPAAANADSENVTGASGARSPHKPAPAHQRGHFLWPEPARTLDTTEPARVPARPNASHTKPVPTGQETGLLFFRKPLEKRAGAPRGGRAAGSDTQTQSKRQQQGGTSSFPRKPAPTFCSRFRLNLEAGVTCSLLLM